MPWMHVTARTVRPHAPLCEPEHAGWLWEQLRECFPRSLAAVLMPNHPHVLAHVEDPEGDRVRLARVLGHFARRVGVRRGLFEPVPPFQVVEGRDKLWRMCRYLALNPCRADLCDDPLRWLWGTSRDVVGASTDPWVSAMDLACELNRCPDRLATDFHRYVSSDPAVAVCGTPCPVPASPQRLPIVGLHRIVLAAAAATRSPTSAIMHPSPTRRLFVQLARHQGWRDTSALAALCHVDRRSINRLAQHPDPHLLRAGALCLGDARLCEPLPRWPDQGDVPFGDVLRP